MSTEFPKTADAVIVGGGVMGASIAYHLAGRGMKKLLLLEREEFFGLGATGRCAGGVRYQFSTEVNVRLSLKSLPMLERFEEELGQAIDYRQCGYLFLMTRSDELPLFQRSQSMQNRLGANTDPGGDRKSLLAIDPDLVMALEALVDPNTRGAPMSPLRWTCKSRRKLSKALAEQGHEVSHTRVAQLLADMGYSLQGTLKTLDEASHPDRNNQFRYINRCVKVFQHAGQPVISVDAKKIELVGDFANAGREYRPQGQPEQVKMHDFPDLQLGKVCPYGVYDPTHNQGWVSVGIDHDTAQFAVESIRRWWEHMGKECYSQAHALLITADGGGSNASRNRLWKVELQKFADETGLVIAPSCPARSSSPWGTERGCGGR